MTRYVTLTPHCFIGGKNRGVKGQKICSTALCLSHAICRTAWLYRRHVSHSGKRPALISPVPEGTVQLRDLSQCLHGPAFQMESISALHIPATPESHHSHSCAVSLGLGAAFSLCASHIPPDKFLLHFSVVLITLFNRVCLAGCEPDHLQTPIPGKT